MVNVALADTTKKISANEIFLGSDVKQILPTVFPRTDLAKFLKESFSTRSDEYVSKIAATDAKNAFSQSDTLLKLFETIGVDDLFFSPLDILLLSLATFCFGLF